MRYHGSMPFGEGKKTRETYQTLFPLKKIQEQSDRTINHLMDCLEFSQKTLPGLLSPKRT